MNNQQQLIMQQLLNANFQQNPLFMRAQQMANGKTEAELQQIAMNICRERGLDFQAMLQQFQSMM